VYYRSRQGSDSNRYPGTETVTTGSSCGGTFPTDLQSSNNAYRCLHEATATATEYFRNTNHATETACTGTSNKVASLTQGPGPVQTISLTTGQSGCWYADDTTGSTIPSGDWETRLDMSASAQAQEGAFNIGTGAAGTTVPITVGFQPKVVIFWESGRTESTDTELLGNEQRGFGVAVTPTDRRVICSQSQDAQSSAVVDRAHRADAAICSMTTGGAIDGLGDLSSMDANGFTLIIDDAFATDLRIHYLALGGSAITTAATGMFTEPAVAGNQDVTTVGFQPDAVVFFSAGIATDPPGTATDSKLMIGYAAGAGNPNDAVWIGASDDGQGTMVTRSYHRAGESVAMFDAGETVTDARASVTAWLSNGFTLNWVERASNRRVFYLALKGGSYAVGDVLTRTTSGTVVETGVGFSPVASLFLSHNKAQSTADTPQANDELSIGAFGSTANRGAQCVNDWNGVGTSVVGTGVEHDELYCNMDGAGNPEGLMGIQSIDSDGFTLSMDLPDPAAEFVSYLAFGPRITYDVQLQIWNKDLDTVAQTIGSCTGVATFADDVQCLVTGVPQKILTANQVVRVRIAHASSTGTIGIGFDDADSTGDSRVLLPRPQLVVQHDWSGVPTTGALYDLCLEAHIANSGGQSVLVQVLTPPSTWNTRVTLTKTADDNADQCYTLTASELNSGAPSIRWIAGLDVVDSTQSDTKIDHERVIVHYGWRPLVSWGTAYTGVSVDVSPMNDQVSLARYYENSPNEIQYLVCKDLSTSSCDSAAEFTKADGTAGYNTVATAVEPTSYPSLATTYEANGDVWIAYAKDVDGTTRAIYAVLLDYPTATWGAPEVVDSLSGTIFTKPSVGIDKDNNVHALYVAASGPQVYYNKRISGVWYGRIAVDASSDNPTIVVRSPNDPVYGTNVAGLYWKTTTSETYFYIPEFGTVILPVVVCLLMMWGWRRTKVGARWPQRRPKPRDVPSEHVPTERGITNFEGVAPTGLVLAADEKVV